MFEKTKHHAANFDFCPINTFPGNEPDVTHPETFFF